MDNSEEGRAEDRLNALFDGNAPTRRDAIALGGGALLGAGLGTLLGASPAAAEALPGKGNQSDWRFCKKCFSMFYSLPDTSVSNGRWGVCAADGKAHAAQGFVFSLYYDYARVQPVAGRDSQFDWAFCQKCFCLFWNGGTATTKGRCKAGGGHVIHSFNFGLPHDNPANPGQTDWRFCGNCSVLFYDDPKNANKGKCPAGAGPNGGHVRSGNSANFQMPFRVDGVQDKILTAFSQFLSILAIPNASIVVMQQDGKQFGWGFGNRQSSTIVPLASLSKAITATAIANLVDAGKLKYRDKLVDLLKTFLTDKSKPITIADTRVNDITVAHLLRHISGFPSGRNPMTPKLYDPVDPPQAANIHNGPEAREAFIKEQLGLMLDRAPGTMGSGSDTYHYNNVNYAVLGKIIEQASGQASYEAYCKQTVLNPHPRSDVRIGVGIPMMSSFGGWEMSVEQYADFIWRHYRNMTTAAETFMSDSYTVGYGLGVQVKKTSRGRNIWHTGNWPGGDKKDWPTTFPPQFSSYFALWDNELLVVTSHERSLTSQQLIDLDKLLSGAAGK